jgi:predicted MFS family arabinose efflux permease
MMDRWGIRRVALPGIVLYAIAMCLLGFSPASLLIFTILFAIAESASSIQTPIGYAKAIAAWFDRRRGTALGIAMSGVGLGGFVMPQLAQVLIESIGWRGAYTALGLLTLAIAFPAVALWIREPRPGEGEHRLTRTASDLPGHTVHEAVRTIRFWILVTVFFLVAIALNGTVAHVVPLLTDAGLSPASAAATMGVFGLATMIGRLLAGYLVDRFFAPYVATVLFLSPIAGFVFLASAAGALPALGVALVGLGLGTEIDLIAFLVSRYLGQRAFGEIYGYCFMVFGLGSSFGRFVGGYVYDMAGSYNPALIGAAGALVAAVIFVNCLGRYVYPVRHEIAPELAVQPAMS